MRNFSALLPALAICFSACACTPAALPEELPDAPVIDEEEPAGGESGNDGSAGESTENGENDTDDSKPQPEESMTIRITVGGKVFRADIDDTETGRAFLAKLPMELDMSELNGNEKYCYGVTLPRDDKYCDTIAAGDLMLYSGNCVVLFYGPAGGYSYTRIGRLQSADGLAAALGRGSVAVKFER